MSVQTAFSAADYDRLWSRMDDFTRYNPGSRHRRRLLLKLILERPFKSYLDVGCGPGDLLLAVRKACDDPAIRMTGCDLSPLVIEQNRKAIPGVDFRVYNLESPETPIAERFDLVTCSEVLEHLNRRDQAFARLASLVNPGGRLVISVPCGKVFETERHFGHTTHPTIEELRGLADANGLRVSESLCWGFPTYRLFKEVTNINADWALKKFSSGKYKPWQVALNDFIYWVNFLNVPSSMGCQLFASFEKP